MAAFKLVVADPKNAKSTVHELKDKHAQPLLGLKIGDVVDATVLGLKGKIRITGGSDKSGIPMRSDVHGAVKKYVLLSKGVGLQAIEFGQRRRKLIRGNLITDDIYQLNVVLTS
ncbi:MAG: S6e family ribosomal protein [Nitrososphaerales archaeon]